MWGEETTRKRIYSFPSFFYCKNKAFSCVPLLHRRLFLTQEGQNMIKTETILEAEPLLAVTAIDERMERTNISPFMLAGRCHVPQEQPYRKLEQHSEIATMKFIPRIHPERCAVHLSARILPKKKATTNVHCNCLITKVAGARLELATS
jgi:hypothetical protein